MTDQQAIYEVMKGGGWYVPHAIKQAVGHRFDKWISAESVTARLRDFRKPQYGGFPVPKRRLPGKSHYEYSLGIQMSLLEAFPNAHLESLISEEQLEATR